MNAMEYEKMRQSQQAEQIKCANQCATPATRPYYGDMATGIAGAVREWRSSTPAEESAKNADHHREQAQKHSAASEFYAAHPEFNEFVLLVRSGAIQF